MQNTNNIRIVILPYKLVSQKQLIIIKVVYNHLT